VLLPINGPELRVLRPLIGESFSAGLKDSLPLSLGWPLRRSMNQGHRDRGLVAGSDRNEHHKEHDGQPSHADRLLHDSPGPAVMTVRLSPLSLGGDVRVGFGRRRGSDLLSIEGGRLFLRCFRRYSLAPEEAVSIERLKPTWYDAGVRIVHNRSDYPRKMTFSCHAGSDEVFGLLERTGFVPCGTGPAGRSIFLPAARFLLAATALHAIVSALFWLLS